MDTAEYESVRNALSNTAENIVKAKRPSYTVGSEDVLANFKRVAARAGISTSQVALTYFLKHVDSICTLISRPDITDPEGEEGRFADALNYLYLLHAIRVEEAHDNRRQMSAKETV